MLNYWLEKVYDVGVCIISVLDVFFDVLVTYQFYIEAHPYFFAISLFILFAAQSSYAVFMACVLKPINPRDSFMHKYNVVIMFLWLPFGQIVPLFLMLYTSYPTFFDKYFNKYGYKFKFNLQEADIFNSGEKDTCYQQPEYWNGIEFNKAKDASNKQKGADPFSSFIRHKVVSHFGFIIEAVIECIPQSILQMIYLIMYHSSSGFNIINIISILMSMTVVASKGTLLSYSIFRKASIFNFLCFALDILGIFTVSSWLFALNQGIHEGEYEFLGHHVWCIAYYYFDMLYYIYITLLWIVFWGCHDFLINVYKRHPNHPWGYIPMILVLITAILLVIPVSLVVLTVRFTLIPLFIMDVFDHSQNKSFVFYNKIYSFIADSSTFNEIHEKILLTNWLLAKVVVQNTENNSFDPLTISTERQCNVANKVAQNMQTRYDDYGTVSLSYLYAILHHHGENHWLHYKYHQLLEVASLLISKKGFWKFILIKISPQTPSKYYIYFIKTLFYCCWDSSDIDITFAGDMDKYVELELEFWKTIEKIQDIIQWSGFLQIFTHHWNQFMFHLAHIRTWFRMYTLHLTVFRICFAWFCRRIIIIICDKIPTFLHWFANGLKCAVIQDITNIYLTIERIAHGGYYDMNHNRSAMTLDEYADLWDLKIQKIRRNKQILRWNVPKCWSSYDALFKNVSSHNYGDFYIYRSNKAPWIGRALFVFVIVVIFKCVHSPIRNLYRWKRFEDLCSFLILFPLVCIVVPLILCLAVYSLFAPALFIIQHWILFGVFSFEHNKLQIVFTLCYLLIFMAILALLPKVWKFVYGNFHLYSYFNHKQATPELYADYVVEVYYSKFIRNELVDEFFGTDIGGMIKTYLPNFQVWSRNSAMY